MGKQFLLQNDREVFLLPLGALTRKPVNHDASTHCHSCAELTPLFQSICANIKGLRNDFAITLPNHADKWESMAESMQSYFLQMKTLCTAALAKPWSLVQSPL